MTDEQPRSKSTRVSGNRKSGVIVKRIEYDPKGSPNSYESYIPDLGDVHPYIQDLFFFDADFQPTSGKYADLSLNYSWIENGAFESELRAQTQDVPLERHPDYRLRWNHNLISTDESKTSVPAWWLDDTTLLTTVDAFIAKLEEEDEVGNYVLKTNVNAFSENTNVVSGRLKPNNTYKKPTIAVTETIYYNNLQGAKSEVSEIGKIAIPREKFGYTDGDFLLTAAPITRSGGYWMVRKVYEYSDVVLWKSDGTTEVGWDIDLYEIEDSE